MSDYRPKAGQSFEEMMKADRAEKQRKKDEAFKLPESLGVPFQHTKCPLCEFTDFYRQAPNDKGLVEVTCNFCDNKWLEDQMFITMVKDTTFS